MEKVENVNNVYTVDNYHHECREARKRSNPFEDEWCSDLVESCILADLLHIQYTSGGSRVVAPCTKTNGCTPKHYHRKKSDKPAFSEAQKRIAEKVKLCKVSNLELCPEQTSCYLSNPLWEHYHHEHSIPVDITPDQDGDSVNGNEDALREMDEEYEYQQSLIDAERNQFDDDVYAQLGEPDLFGDTDALGSESETCTVSTDVIHPPAYRFYTTGGVDNTVSEVTRQSIADTILASCDDQWTHLFRLPATPNFLSLGDGGFASTHHSKTFLSSFRRQNTSGHNEQCFYTALAGNHYRRGQVLKQKIMANTTEKLRIAFDGDGRTGGDELCATAVTVMKKPIMIICAGHVKYYPWGTSLFSDCVILKHVQFGPSGHYEWCTTTLVGSMLDYVTSVALIPSDGESAVATLTTSTVAGGDTPVVITDDCGNVTFSNPLVSQVISADLPPDIPIEPDIPHRTEKPRLRTYHCTSSKNKVKKSLPQPDGDHIVVVQEGYIRIRHDDETASFFVANGRNMTDGSVIYERYDPNTQCVSGERLSTNFTVVEDNSYAHVVPGDNYGHYTHGPSHERLVGSLLICHDMVVQARSHRWLLNFRLALMNAAHVASLGSFYDVNTLYRGETKVRSTLCVSKEILSVLRSTKLTMTLGELQNRHAGAPILENFTYIPLKIILDTLLFFSEERTAAQSALKGTVASHVRFLQTDGVHKMKWTSPAQQGLLSSISQEGAKPAVYSITDNYEAVKGWLNNCTVAYREYYRPSSDAHGSADNPTNPPSGKFELVSAAHGCGFSDPYPFFRDMIDRHETQRRYQTIGCAMGSRSAIVEVSPTEQARSFLRCSSLRPNEARLFANQRDSYEYALWLRQKHNPQLMDDLTNRIRKFDKKYQPDIARPVYHPTDIQKLMHEVNHAYDQHRDTETDTHVQGDFYSRLRAYIRDLGVKMPMRYGYVKVAEDDVNDQPKTSRYNQHSAKAHTPSKYKLKDGVPQLAYSRAVLSMTGKEWVDVDPTACKRLKHMLQIPLTIIDNVLRYGNYEKKLDFDIRDTYYIALLEDTKLEDIADFYSNAVKWASSHPSSIVIATHGDDQVYLENINGDICYTESDIVFNDGSYTDTPFRISAFCFHEQGNDAVSSYTQVGKPIKIVHPDHFSQNLTVRSTSGMSQRSGWGLTTGFNTERSRDLGFATALLGFTEGSEALGFNCEILVFRKNIEQVTFLSKCAYQSCTDQFFAFTELASLLRNFGKVTGDFLGTNKELIKTKFDRHILGVVLGWCHEPESMIIYQIRRIVGAPVQRKTTYTMMEEIDHAYIKRYYPSNHDQGVIDYLFFIEQLTSTQDLYGNVYVNQFLDTVMSKRYGMAGVST